jgi:hypothetical protein
MALVMLLPAAEFTGIGWLQQRPVLRGRFTNH